MSKVFSGYSWRAIDGLLGRWAEWVYYGCSSGFQDHSPGYGVTEGFKADNWFRVKQYTARGKQTRACGGHVVLTSKGYGTPDDIRLVSNILYRLPDSQYLAICAWYGLVRTKAGDAYTDEQKANALGISLKALLERLRRGRKNFAQILAKTPVND